MRRQAQTAESDGPEPGASACWSWTRSWKLRSMCSSTRMSAMIPESPLRLTCKSG